MEGHHARSLTESEIAKLQNDTRIISDFKQQKFEKEAQRNWDLFYKRNTTKFFKDRHWTTREFKELCGKEDSEEKLTVLEVGCGVGNFLFPLIQDDSNIVFYACDFSPRAVQFVKDNPLYAGGQCTAFQCDITADALTKNIPPASVDLVTMIFVLSAIHPEKMRQALENVHTVLKPGGYVLFRDYGLYDHAMLRFTPGHKLSDQFYVRQDGTRAYYFSQEELSSLFIEAGFNVVTNQYIQRETVNHKEALNVKRIFLQAKCQKLNSIKVCDCEQLSTESSITDDKTNISAVNHVDGLTTDKFSDANLEQLDSEINCDIELLTAPSTNRQCSTTVLQSGELTSSLVNETDNTI